MAKAVRCMVFAAISLPVLLPGRLPAQSAATSIQGAPANSPVARKDDRAQGHKSLTFHGITLYGVIDTAIAWQSHGVPLSGDFPPGLEYVISKNSGKARVSFDPNALSQSKVGLKGLEPINDDLSAVFQAEAHLVPTAGRLTNGQKSLVHNNGRPANRQTANGDSSKDGEAFAGQAYLGLASKRFGTVTFGRQWALMLDNIVIYDPVAASHAFSVIGYQGAAQAGASTEDARFNRSVKYAYRRGHARVIGMFQFGEGQAPVARAYGVDLGYDLGRLSIDGAYSHVNDSVSASSLTAAQVQVVPADSLTASVSDNNAIGFFAKYSGTRTRIFGGFERIEYQNPRHPLRPGYRTVGGFLLSIVNNQAYPRHRLQTYSWLGIRYALTPRIDLTGAYYRVDQNSYAVSRCGDPSSPLCSGHLNALSAVADYRLNQRFDLYTGAMYSEVAHGLASGFAHRTSVDPMVGARISF